MTLNVIYFFVRARLVLDTEEMESRKQISFQETKTREE